MTDKAQPENSRNRSKSFFLKILGESASVIAAILLALAINEWWEDHERDLRKAELLDKLYIELNENLSRLKASHEHHSRHLDFIRTETQTPETLTDADYESIFSQMYQQGIMRPALLTDANWEIAKLTDLISYIELEQLSALIQVFALFEAHEFRWRQNGDAQTLVNHEEDPQKIVELYFEMLNETWWIEKSVIAALEALLNDEQIGNQPWES